MLKHSCPHCGAAGISALRKAFLGPALPTTCSECRKNVGVPYGKSMLALLPWFVALGLFPFVSESGLQSFWLGALGAASVAVLWGCLVPLTRR